MVRINCHIHSSESDGELSPREIVEMAVKKNLTHICFTDHFRFPREIRDYSNKRKHSDEYYDELRKLREEFVGKIDILIGVELDWVDGYEDWFVEELGDRDYDFILGSVHWMKNEGRFEVVHSSDGSGDDRLFIERYFAEVRKMVEFGLIDCVAHLDIFRKRLRDNGLLNEGWYRELVIGTLELMKEKGACLEVNCVGWRILEEQFPQRWILEEAVRLDVGLTIGNDFHKLKFCSIDQGVDRVVNMLRDIGCENVLVFRERKREKLRI